MAGIDKRTFLQGTMSVAASAFLWGCVGKGEPGGLTATQLQLLGQVADLVIPRTDTPGAVDIGVPAFVALALAHGLGGTDDPKAPGAPPDNDYGAWLEAKLGANPAMTLPALDAAAFAKDTPPSPWKAIKGLILTGYFTSEAGATRTLRYELLPGRFDPDLPLKPGDKSWASDWTAVDFG
ncbi:gluconate 2-dehydrogenase subunit 3 family protein [Sphingomonas sp. SUN039]|uniref:gluconate 2-dehydrogenase subunit 3 family protein n=1 Tax=Sphingomonas sp. SUN039 TaxID=2937787 RepID=UPI0021644D39|nr:gluconate 2-dehydrogenase subunit 3 family protein [Sphingomonas sp. SUN039]UVO53102.1 gluconate 2-dehydrogenase subunit 3 family protein [Sphingomonas sp. SUN039]